MGAPPRMLIPGPVPIDPRVHEELAKPAQPHYGDEWVRKYHEIEDMLRRLFQAKDVEVYPIAGPGHSGLETIAFTLLRRGNRVAVIDNGFFGTRCADVLRTHHVQVEAIPSKWGEPPDLAAVEKVVKKGVACLTVVHNETSTGMTNPIRELAEVATKHGAWVIGDAVSSLGGIALPCGEWGIETAFAASQKCLAAPPGIAPVMVSRRLLEEADPATAEGWYLNLFSWEKIKKDWGDWHPQPTTISSNILFAFHRALELLHEEGLDRRIRRHQIIGRAYREGLTGLGFSLFCDEKYASNTVSSVRPPKGLEAMDLIKRLRTDDAISIAGTLGPMRGQGIRIGHLGTQASPEFVEPMLTALAGYARKAGVQHTEDAVDRAMQIASKAAPAHPSREPK